MDRTVLPGNPAGEAADGVVGAEDRASTADSPHRVSKDKDSGRGASRPRVAAKIAAMAGQDVPTARNSVVSAPGR